MDRKGKRLRETDGGGSQPEEVVGELAMEPKSSVTAEDWHRTLSRVVSAVAALNITAPRAFDTEVAGTGCATGFVVDKLRGIMLTNRHVVLPGPVVAEATFANREEIPVYPIYRDPVHDFGFFRYDPAAIDFHEYEGIPLAPEAASVGLEIWIVGNDSNEKVSILEGTLARLDREAPNYKKDGYNEFNTFYMQAAAGTKGGSSGSPVVDCQGRAVALNAGGRSSGVSAFFLPLERVVRALNLIRGCWDTYGIGSQPESVYIPRGTLQVTFQHKGFEETRRLGLMKETEKMVRHVSPAGETGMLVVDSTVPKGPADGHLEPGDVLVRMNGSVLTKFLTMESLLDESVDKEINLQIERGGTPLTVTLKVKDLYSITPNHFLELSGAVIHPLSYQQARNFRLECGQVYVAEPGYMLSRASVPRLSVIKKLAGNDIPDLNALIAAISKLKRGDQVVLQYVTYTEPHRKKHAVVRIDQHGWYTPPQLYSRNDATGLWAAKPAMPLKSDYVVSFHQGGHTDVNSKGIPRNSGSMKGSDLARTIPGYTSLAEREIEPALARFEVRVPPICMIDGVHAQHFIGVGVIIHHSDSLGLIAVDRNTVAISICDIMVSFATHSIKIPGEVVFLHPAHNFALVAYDPSALGDSASVIRAAELRPEPALRRGDPVYLVGVNESLQVMSRETKVANYTPINISYGDCPRYCAMNMDVIELDYAGFEYSGVLTDEQGRVQALWASASRQLYGCTSRGDDQFVVGIPIYLISQVLEKIISRAPGPFRLVNGIRITIPSFRLLEVELSPIQLSEARSYGLSDSWVQALTKKDPMRRQVLQVKGCFAGSKAENVLEDGDMILAIDKKPITCFLDIDNACQNLVGSDDMLKITIFREGKEIDLIVGTDVRDGNGTTRLVNWCGCIVQNPHSAVRALGFMPKEGHGVYVARYCNGSPGHRYGLCAPQWIIEVNGRPTPDLESFIEVLKGLEGSESVRLKTVKLSGKSCVLTLKQDLHYWPTWELSFEPETATWQRRTIKTLKPAAA